MAKQSKTKKAAKKTSGKKVAKKVAKKAKVGTAAKATPKKPKVTTSFIHDLARPFADAQGAIAIGRSWADGKIVDPNVGRLSPTQLKAAYHAHHHLNAAGEPLDTPEPKTPSTIPAAYQPIAMDVAAETNARTIVTCQAQKGARQPAAWDEKKFGEWKNTLRITDPNNPLDRVRKCHKKDGRKLVLNENDLVTLQLAGRASVVIGDADSALFSIAPSKSGSYGGNSQTGAFLSLGESKGIGNLVGRFNTDYREDVLDDFTNPGMSIGWGPQMVVDWGYLVRDGKRLSYAQIRSAAKKLADGDKDACKNIKFELPSEDIIGEPISESELWGELPAKVKSCTTSEKTWYNLSVQCRVSPHEIKPNGLFALQIGIVPVPCFGDSLTDGRVRWVVGKGKNRLGLAHNESRSEARERLGLNDAPKPKATKPKAAKPKTAAKPTAAKSTATAAPKAAATKTPAPNTVAPKQSDKAAAPVTPATTPLKIADESKEPVTSK